MNEPQPYHKNKAIAFIGITIELIFSTPKPPLWSRTFYIIFCRPHSFRKTAHCTNQRFVLPFSETALNSLISPKKQSKSCTSLNYLLLYNQSCFEYSSSKMTPITEKVRCAALWHFPHVMTEILLFQERETASN